MERGPFPDEELPEMRPQMKALKDAFHQLLPNLFTAMSLALGTVQSRSKILSTVDEYEAVERILWTNIIHLY